MQCSLERESNGLHSVGNGRFFRSIKFLETTEVPTLTLLLPLFDLEPRLPDNNGGSQGNVQFLSILNLDGPVSKF